MTETEIQFVDDEIDRLIWIIEDQNDSLPPGNDAVRLYNEMRINALKSALKVINSQ